MVPRRFPGACRLRRGWARWRRRGGQRRWHPSRSLGDMARRLAEEGPGRPLRDGHRRSDQAPSELAALAAELERTSARLAQAQDHAAALERSRRELVAWVSHDLRTPLAGIRAM